MKQHNLPQGSPEWLAHRARRRNASEAAAVLACSEYITRTQLLHAMHTGIRPEVTPVQQRIFDDGHVIEAAQRTGAEETIGEDLFPVVGTEVVDGIELSASFDGLTMMEDTGYECKTLNEALRAALPHPGPEGNDAANLPKMYRVQMEQQLAVCAGQRILFVAATLDGSDVRRCWYYPDLALRAEIIAGWKQFDADLAAYVVPQERAPEPVAAKKASLPALVVDVEGKVVQSNLHEWKTAAIAHIGTINTTLVTDQDFADADEAVKWCESSKARLQEVKAAALARMTSVEQLFVAIDEIVATMDGKRLTLANLVKARKEARKTEIVEKGRTELARHVAALEQRLRELLPEGTVVRENLMPPIVGAFADAIKGKRSFANMESAVADETAGRKVEANRACELREKNLRALQAKAAGHKHLFADWRDLIGKDAELVEMTIGQRIQAEKEAEERRLAAERERIRQEEEARARAAAAREQAEREAAERRQREEAEAAERAEQQRQAALRQASEQLQAAAQPLAALPTISTSEARAVSIAREIGAIASRAGDSLPENVVTLLPKAGPPTLKLGEIKARIAPLQIDAAGLRQLGFDAAGREGAAVLFHEADFPQMVEAMRGVLFRALSTQQRAA